MKIKRYINDEGECKGFEVSNGLISRAGMARVLSKLEGVNITHFPKFYDDEVFCEFEIDGFKFRLTEPWGDSDIYELYLHEANSDLVEKIVTHFEDAKPIQGGDFAQRLFFLFNWSVASAFWIGVFYLVVWAIG